MVNTRTDAELAAAVQAAVDAMLPQIREQVREEYRTGAVASGSNPPPVTIHTWLERFNKQKPRSFEKAVAPVDAENWISHMEKIFDVMDCNDAFKTRLAVYKFEGDALAWWKAYKQAKGGDAWVLTLTWAAFKELFFLQFFPRAEQERLKREYHSIRQRASENSTEYMQRFLRLAGFLGQAAGTAEEQAKNFRWGLHKSILDHVMCIQFTDVAQVADVARNLEILRDRDDYDRWLLTHGIELAMVKCLKSPEYQGILGHALGRAVDYGMQEGLAAVHEHGVAGTPFSVVVEYNPETAESNYLDAVRALEEADFPLVHLLKSKKDSRMDEVLDCFLLDGPLADLPVAAHLQPCLEQLSVPIYHANVNSVVGETSLSFALLNVHARAEGAKKHAATLRQLMVDIVSHPLSSQNLLGEASTSVVISCVEDLDTDEDLGSAGRVHGPRLDYTVRIMQISKENGQKPDKTEHEMEKSARDRNRVYKNQGIDSKKGSKVNSQSNLVNQSHLN
ncbi:zinc finger, CCHC-type, retrotransposon gag domain protein [Tanacetum coccineum]